MQGGNEVLLAHKVFTSDVGTHDDYNENSFQKLNS